MKKRSKILLIITGILIILVFIGQYYANSLIQGIIRKEISAIQLEQQENYHIEVGEIKVRLFLKRFILRDVKIATNKAGLNESDRSFSIDLKKLVVKVSDFKSVLTDKKLIVKDIEFDRSRIDLVLPANRDSIPEKEKSRFKSKRLSTIIIGSFGINKGDFYLHKSNNDSIQLISSVSKLDFKLNDIEVDLKEERFADLFSFKDLFLSLGEIEYHDSQMHALIAKGVHYTNQKNGIKLDKIFLKNRESLEDFTKKPKEKGVWTSAELTNVFLNLDINKLKDKNVLIESLSIAKLKLELFQLQSSTKTETPNYSELLAKINIPFIVDTFTIQDASINYSLKKNASTEIDDYQLKKVALELLHISNDSLYMLEHPRFIGSLESDLWTNTQLKANFSLDVNDIENSVSLTIDNLPQRKIKKYIKEFKLGDFRSGQIKQIEFNYSSDSNQYSGNTRFSINNLDFRYHQFPNDESLKELNVKVNKVLFSSRFKKEKNKQLNLSIDTIDIQSPKISLIGQEKQINNSTSKKVSKFSPSIAVNLFKVSDASFSYQKSGDDDIQLIIDKSSITDRFLVIDLSKKGKNKLVNSGNFSINLDGISFSKAPTNYLDITTIQIDKKKDELTIVGLRYENNSSKNSFQQLANGGNYISAYLERVSLELDLHRNLFDPIQCKKVTLSHPILTFMKDLKDENGTQTKSEIDDKVFPISIDEIEILNADIEVLVNTDKKKEAKIIELKKLNGSITNFSTEKNRKLRATIKSSFFDKSSVELEIAYEQGIKNAPLIANGNIKNISLQTLKTRLAAFVDLNYNDGDLNEIDFDFQASKKRIKGNLSINTINVDHLKLAKEKNADWIHLTIDQVGLSFSKKEKQKINISDLTIDNPLVEIHHVVKFKEKENSISDDKKDLFANKKINKSTVHIENFKIKDGIVHQFDGEGKLIPLTSVEHINLVGNKVDLYDSTKSRLPISINGLELNMKNIIVHSIPKHDMSIGSMELNMQKKKLIIKDLDFKNKNSPEVFFSQQKYRKAWMELFVREVEIDINFAHVFSAHPRISRANIKDAKFTTHVNLDLEVGPEEKYFPNHSLSQAKFPFSIDSIFVDKGQIDVLFRDIEKHGLLQFNDITAKVSNLSSDPKTIKKNNEMVWIMDATLYESGKTHIEVNYTLDKEDDDFSMIGTVTDLNLTDSDTLTKNLYGIRVSDGIAHKIYIDISGDKYEARGLVQFDYEELHVTLDKKKKNVKNTDELKKVKKKDKLNESFVKNIIVNGLLRKKNMPDNGKYIEFGDAYYKREMNKPIFNLMWFTISSGMLNVAESGVIKGLQNMKNNKKEKKTN